MGIKTNSRLNIIEEDGSPTTFPWQLRVTNATLTDNGDGTSSLLTGAGGSEWTDTGTTLHPTETGDDVVIGATSPVSGAKLSVDGDADQIQFLVQGVAGQTADLVVFEDSSGTDDFRIASSGAITFNSAYTFPTADGAAGEVLTTNGLGTLTFSAAGGGVDPRHLIYALMGV